MNEKLNNEVLTPIWFVNEDVKDADEPYFPLLINESLLQWMSEVSELPTMQTGHYGLYSKNLVRYDTTHYLNVTHKKSDETAIRQALIEASETNKPSSVVGGGIQTIVIPLNRRTDKKTFGYFTYQSSTEHFVTRSEIQSNALHYRNCFYRCFEQIYVQDMMQQQTEADREVNRREALFQSAKHLYDQIDVTSVLTSMLDDLEQLYPEAEVLLYLSQDYVEGDARVKPLIFKGTLHDSVEQAFLESKPVIESLDDDRLLLVVPMTGKQAAYGVLCLTIRKEKWESSELTSLLLLTDTAGSAFENAKLYEQSNLLINELRLINEMTKRLNQSLRLSEIFQFATEELISIFDADYCCLLQRNNKTKQFEVKSSNIASISEESFSPEYGFCGIVNRTKEPLIISDYWHTRVVPSKVMDHTGSRSLIATPIFVEGEVVGVILIAHQFANFFSYDNYKLLQVMSTHIGLAVANASLHAEMRRMIITDNLTGLHARHYLDEQIQQFQRKDLFGSLILVDIDLFKVINDTYGHQVGDRILLQVSTIIRASIRADDIAARWGGEELAIYMPGVKSEQAWRIADRIRNQVAEETSPAVTVSCGVSEWTIDQDRVSVESLFYRADMALYGAKNKGRNQVVVGN